MANIITGIRILCSISLLAVSTFSKSFYILYLIAEVSDLIDGTVARKTGTAIDFGSKFDSIADFIFVAVCLINLSPKMKMNYIFIFRAKKKSIVTIHHKKFTKNRHYPLFNEIQM